MCVSFFLVSALFSKLRKVLFWIVPLIVDANRDMASNHANCDGNLDIQLFGADPAHPPAASPRTRFSRVVVKDHNLSYSFGEILFITMHTHSANLISSSLMATQLPASIPFLVTVLCQHHHLHHGHHHISMNDGFREMS